MNKNIYLIGMMGSGKSTISKDLSKKLKYKCLDTDQLIVKDSKFKSIPEIFEKKGESYFRKLESKSLNYFDDKKEYVVATGGGIILNKKNVKKMKKNGIIIYLYASIKTLAKRIKVSKGRPLLEKNNIENKLTNIFNDRKLKYIQASDIKVDTNKLNKKETVDKIIEILEDSYEDFNY
ncbi:MAG: shikimate kinase [Bacillota bacterium]